MILMLLAAALVVFLVSCIIYARWNYGCLEAVGIPVVPPKFILGSDPFITRKVNHDEDLKRFRKYGKFWGFYEGRYPQVFVADAELARRILIKDFDHFRDRRIMDFGHELINEMLDLLPYEKWKTVRNELTPTFTTGKIRAMSGKIEESVRDCVKFIDIKVGKNATKVLDLKRIYVALTTDVIARCAFGTVLTDVNNPDNEFVKMTSDLVGDAGDPPALLSLTMTFPFLAGSIPLFPIKALDFFGGVLKNIIATRRNDPEPHHDMVDTMNELIAKTKSPEYERLGITETTILCQALVFLFAGFETTATTLSMLGYYLSKNPDKQRKLVEEVDQLLAKEGTLTHDNLAELPYMNACIQETLRFVSPLYRTERVCEKDWKHEETGLVIKKGWTAIVASHALHRNPEYWEDPEKFVPERFLPENKDKLNPYAFNAFGQGPRNCVGMRFAKEELIFSLALILKDYTFEATPETKLEFKKGRMFLEQFHPILVKFVRRSNQMT